MADPGFPVGGRRPLRRDADSRGDYVSKILYVKMKESGPLGDVLRGRPLDPLNPISYMMNSHDNHYTTEDCLLYPYVYISPNEYID